MLSCPVGGAKDRVSGVKITIKGSSSWDHEYLYCNSMFLVSYLCVLECKGLCAALGTGNQLNKTNVFR